MQKTVTLGPLARKRWNERRPTVDMEAGWCSVLLFLLLVSSLQEVKPTDAVEEVRGQEDARESAKAEPYILHPRETELLEAAAKGAARLVSSGLSHVTKAPTSPDLLAKLLALMGFDNSKLGAIAINAVIFIAQLISTMLIETKERESEAPSGNPATWIFENSPIEARELMKEATERTLPEKLIEAVRDSSPMATDCVELLICKGAPLLWSMQRALSRPPAQDWQKLTPLNRMYSNFPALDQVADQAAVCNVRFPACRIKYGHL